MCACAECAICACFTSRALTRLHNRSDGAYFKVRAVETAPRGMRRTLLRLTVSRSPQLSADALLHVCHRTHVKILLQRLGVVDSGADQRATQAARDEALRSSRPPPAPPPPPPRVAVRLLLLCRRRRKRYCGCCCRCHRTLGTEAAQCREVGLRSLRRLALQPRDSLPTSRDSPASRWEGMRRRPCCPRRCHAPNREESWLQP